MFKEIADIKTADQLHLPTPEVEYHTYASKPTEIQQDMVKALSERATKVHGGSVDPRKDNMLKITSDGRKLGLDQRVINPGLLDIFVREGLYIRIQLYPHAKMERLGKKKTVDFSPGNRCANSLSVLSSNS